MGSHVTSKRPDANAALAEINDRLQASQLSDEEKQEAMLKAREHVRAERKKKAIDEAFRKAVVEEEREYEPQQAIVDVLIELPKYAAFIRLDQYLYYHGLVYPVSRSKADTILDLMARAWEHQSEIEGKRRKGDDAARPRHFRIGPQHEGLALNNLNDLKQLTTV
ncbi:MAG TPA: hypothetical protein VF748_14800 [Candidatus Acidoferrum sp.]